MKEAISLNARRRKPAQSRARATAEAIRQAFVQLIVEKGYANVSIRQVTTLAGVGIGSFYEYYSSKDALAAVCVRLRIKEIAAVMHDCVMTQSGEPLPARVDALLDAQVRMPLDEPEPWAALFIAERQVSPIEAFRGLYEEFVQLWLRMLSSGSDWPDNVSAQEAAFTAHCMIYSLVSQTLMTRNRSDAAALLRQLRLAVHGYLSVLAPHAYRLHRFDV
jgi:AcrR family transcriptional regulator